LTIIGLILLQTAFCQENYLKGYIVRLTGDTLHGFIDYRNWDRNPDKISFKEIPNAENAIYTPLTIKAFGVRDEIYKSAEIIADISPDVLNDLEYNSDLNLKVEITFLQTIVIPEDTFSYLDINSDFDILNPFIILNMTY
jgi:hypothetical protein